MFRVNFFREDDGSKPVGAFIRTLDVKMKAKVVSDLNETVINPPAELGRLTDARCGERSNR